MGLFSRAQRPAQDALESAVGPSSTLTGTLKSDGGVRVDGVFEGTIEVAGNVVVGRDGRVVGDITARNVTVGGVVQGNIDGTGQLQILATGQVVGDIAVASVMIDEGGLFQGTSRLRGFEQPALPAPTGRPPETAGQTDEARTVEATVRPTAPAGEARSERGRKAQGPQAARRPVSAPEERLEPPSSAAAPEPAGTDTTAGAPEPATADPTEAATAPEVAARTFDDGLDIDFGDLDIEPTIPDTADEGRVAPKTPPPRDRSTRRSGRR